MSDRWSMVTNLQRRGRVGGDGAVLAAKQQGAQVEGGARGLVQLHHRQLSQHRPRSTSSCFCDTFSNAFQAQNVTSACGLTQLHR